MKKFKWLWCAPILLSNIAVCTNTSCSANTIPTIHSVLAKQSKFYADVKMLQPVSDVSLPVCIFNNTGIVYVDVGSFLNCFTIGYPGRQVKWTATYGEHTTTITNSYSKATCSINFISQQMIFSDYDAFTMYSDKIDNPLEQVAIGGENYFQLQSIKYVPKKHVIDFSQYNIKLYWYKDKGYIPYEIYADILFPWTANMGSRLACEYISDGHNFYLTSNNHASHKKMIRNGSLNFFNKSYLEYCFNLFALCLDNLYGMDNRLDRSTNTRKHYFKKGQAYNLIKPFYNQLTSTKEFESDAACTKILNVLLGDGGHTHVPESGTWNIFTVTEDMEAEHPVYTFPEYNTADYYNVASWLTTCNRSINTFGIAPRNFGNDYSNSYYKEYTYGSDKIAYMHLQNFSINGGDFLTQSEVEKGRKLPEGCTQLTQTQDAIRTTMYANEAIQKDHKESKQIKNLVIDLTANPGGVVYAELFVASWICKNLVYKMGNSKTGSYAEFKPTADIDGDGKITDNDFLPDDIKVYVLTSAGTFSAGNALACHISDFRDNRIIIGQNTGGGACCVNSKIANGLGGNIRISSTQMQLRKKSTETNWISNDDGPGVDFDLGDNVLYVHDRGWLNRKILEK